MKIKVTEERECCQQKDLKSVHETPVRGRDPVYKFCVHCGRWHEGESERDPAGGTDWVYKRMRAPWEAP
jgi:hypothetical protein